MREKMLRFAAAAIILLCVEKGVQQTKKTQCLSTQPKHKATAPQEKNSFDV